jgi:hypothetical protein
MAGVESRLHHKASASAQTDLNRSAAHYRCWPLCLGNWNHFHGYELRRFRFPQPLLPSKKLPALLT